MKWQDLELQVRTIASFKWRTEAKPEIINGVKVDCVLKPRPDYWVIIEITQEESLTKLRTDLGKFAALRLFLFTQNIYADCYFVTESSPPPSIYDTGAGYNVNVKSLTEFGELFFNFNSYRHARTEKRFGSAVNPTSGEKDARSYVPVKYEGVNKEGLLTLEHLAAAVREGKRIILLGNYGTGKSRCIQELFALLSSEAAKSGVFYPIAIDLRDNWGTKRGSEIIQRHFDDLGLSEQASAVIQILEKNSLCLLLDGFDEIGSQAWSATRLAKIRTESLLGVKDLVSRTKGGVIITGREHYFNSSDEMFSCLGISPDSALVVGCADEFTDDEMREYLKPIGADAPLPSWIPRRPLVCQIMVEMGKETLSALNDEQGSETSFWEVLVTALCEREARIHLALDAVTIRRVLRKLAHCTRSKSNNVGPISIHEINNAFESITGHPPGDESAVMLQRLPGLGRLTSESTDRHFVDEYILDGLRAEHISELAQSDAPDVLNEKWINPLRRFGLTLLADELSTAASITHFFKLMRQAAGRQNGVLAGDILAAILMSATNHLDFGDLVISDAHISYLNFSGVPLKNLSLSQSVLDDVDISECQVSDVTISDCIIQQLMGVAAAQGLPKWIQNSQVETYEAVTTVSRIRRANLTPEQRIFVTLVKKVFFQPGAGRKEEALLRGLGVTENKKTAERLLNVLRTEGIIGRFKGAEGWVYTPNRNFARRMHRILTELTLCEDELWRRLG